MDTQKTTRFLAATAVVFALAILIASPAQAYRENDSGSAPASGAVVPAEPTEPLPSTSGLETGTWAAIAAGAVLVLALGGAAVLLTTRHRRVALP